MSTNAAVLGIRAPLNILIAEFGEVGVDTTSKGARAPWVRSPPIPEATQRDQRPEANLDLPGVNGSVSSSFKILKDGGRGMKR